MIDASDVLVERLLAWGVDTVFGLPGDGINGVFEALRKQQERIRFIHVRHEEAAAFMACAYAKFTGSWEYVSRLPDREAFISLTGCMTRRWTTRQSSRLQDYSTAI